MIVNKNTSNRRVKFISYDGEYPNLCRGGLVLEIDGKLYKFGHHYMKFHFDDSGNGYYEDEDPGNPNFDSFWSSGGSVEADEDWNWDIRSGEWEIDVTEIPEQFRDLADEIDTVFNENVESGCCGGCT